MKKKVIILDFDGTLYSGIHKFDNIPTIINANRRKFFPRISDNEYNQILQEFPQFLNVTSGRTITLCMYDIKNKFKNLDISTTDFYNWQNSIMYDIIIDPTQIVDINYLTNLCNNYPVYIVSNSSPSHLKHYMEVLNINPNLFKDIISNQFLESDLTKKHYYKDILTKENCNPKNAYVFGDSVEADLKPAEVLGINTVFIDNANDLPGEIDKILR